MPSFSQTLLHPEKVQIRPSTSGADSLRIWGGLQAGPNGTVQVIMADGSINGSLSIPDGTITFAKWASNGCQLGQSPIYSGTVWQCGTGGGGGFDPTLSYTISGTWRFTLNTTFGDDTGSPDQLVHVYKSASTAGIRIESGLVANDWWDLVSGVIDGTTRQLTIGTSGVTPLRLTPTGVGILKTGAPGTALDVTGTVTATGLTVNGTVGSHLIPTLPDTYDLGSSTKLWGQAYISQVNSVLFAEQTAQLFGGWLIVGHNAGSFATDVLVADNQIDFGKSMTPGDFILVRAHSLLGTPTYEYLQVGTWQTGNVYAVDRSMPPTTNPSWPQGTPFLVLGNTGDGRIELNSYEGSRIQFIRQGATYEAQTEHLRLGQLDGLPDMPAGEFGFYAGDITASGIAYQASNSTLTVRGTIRATSGWFGDTSNDVTIDSSGLNIGSTGAVHTNLATYSSNTGFWVGYDSATYKLRIGEPIGTGNKYIVWDGTQLLVNATTLFGDGDNITNIDGAAIQTGSIQASGIATNVLTAAQMAIGVNSGNLVQNSEPSLGLSGWTIPYGGTCATSPTSQGVNLNTDWYPAGGGAGYFTITGTPANNACTDVGYTDPIFGLFPVVTGERYQFSSYVGLNRAKSVQLVIIWFTDAGTYVDATYGTVKLLSEVLTGGNSLSTFSRLSVFGTAPATADRASVSIRVTYDGSGTNPYLFWTRAMFASADTGQVAPSPWTPAGVTRIVSDMIGTGAIIARTIYVENLAAINANMGSITAGSIVVGTTNKLWLNEGSDGILAVGGSTKASAPFRVTAAGALTSTSGSIGGFSIGSANLTAGTGENGVGMSTDTIAFWAGNTTPGSAEFRVSQAGVLTASGVSIGGSIDATSGSLGGLTIDGTLSFDGSNGLIEHSHFTLGNGGLLFDEAGSGTDYGSMVRWAGGAFIAQRSDVTHALHLEGVASDTIINIYEDEILLGANGATLTLNSTALVPGTSDTFDLGTSTVRFETVFAGNMMLRWIAADQTGGGVPVVWDSNGSMLKTLSGQNNAVDCSSGAPYMSLTFQHGIVTGASCGTGPDPLVSQIEELRSEVERLRNLLEEKR